MAHFGFTYEYLISGIRWPKLQKMLLDASDYDYGDVKYNEGKSLQNNGSNPNKLNHFLNSIKQ